MGFFAAKPATKDRTFKPADAKGGNAIVAKKTALVCIEYQNEFTTEGGKLNGAVKECMDSTGMLQKTVDLAETVRTAGGKVFHVPIMFKADATDNPNKGLGILAGCAKDSLFTEKTWNSELCKEMEPKKGDVTIVGKKGLDAFPGTDLEAKLLEHKIETVMLCGFLTNCCVESTMRTACEKGFNVVTVTDCCATTSLDGHKAATEGTFGMFSVSKTAQEATELIARYVMTTDGRVILRDHASPAKSPEEATETIAPPPAVEAPRNLAFVFAKPHANTPQMQELIKKKFDEKGISIVSEGEIDGATIDTNKFIDQHYYAIASKATLVTPDKLNVPADKFLATFGEEWETVKSEERVFNALDIQQKLGWDQATLDAKWNETNVDNKTRVKFGGGFYCGKMDVDGKSYYTFNAFFMTMRGKFTQPTESIHYYVVQYSPDKLSWADFRGEVLGPTNPADAPKDSLRGMLHADWEKLGLKAAPNTGDNGVHASASPFEGLAERTNWLSSTYKITEDPFGKMLIEAGLTEETIAAWSVDPQVTLVKGEPKKGSLFDALEDMNVSECLAKCVELNAAQSVEIS